MSKKKLKLKRPIKIFLNFLLLLSLVTGTYLFINRKETSIKSPNKSTSTKRPRIVNASFIGDLLYEQPYYDWIGTSYNDKGYYDLVKPYFLNDDLTLANMEVPIGGKELGVSGTVLMLLRKLGIKLSLWVSMLLILLIIMLTTRVLKDVSIH